MKTSTWLLIAAGAAALLLLTRRGQAQTSTQPPVESVPPDPFAQSRFEDRMTVVMLLPPVARIGAALVAGLEVPSTPGDSVRIPRGVSYPTGSAVSSGSSLYRLL